VYSAGTDRPLVAKITPHQIKVCFLCTKIKANHSKQHLGEEQFAFTRQAPHPDLAPPEVGNQVGAKLLETTSATWIIHIFPKIPLERLIAGLARAIHSDGLLVSH
jgi:hypothetical protein